MAKKKVTKKRTVKKAAPKASINKTQAIKKILAATPDKSPKEIADKLTAKGIDVSPNYVSTIKTNMKTETSAPKKTTKKKVVAKKKVAVTKKARKKKVSRRRQAPKATSITYEQLRMAKDLAQQLGGVEKAKETLAALSELTTD